MAVILETRGLTTHFHTYEGVVQALSGIDLSMARGETFGLVGESGCGKSVFVRSLLRIIQAPGRIESGRIFYYPDANDQKTVVDLLSLSEAQMQSMRGEAISMIFQEPNAALNPVMTIGDQVAESFLLHQTPDMIRKVQDDLANGGARGGLPLWMLKIVYDRAAHHPNQWSPRILNRLPLLRRWRVPLKQEALARSIAIIRELGIPNAEEIVRRYPHNLSGGMKQRIVIAMALACGPDLLIADEATSNLDVTIQAQILELLQLLRQTDIGSILLITHDLGVVAETCDRVGVMYAGTLCEVAPVVTLLETPLHPYTRALLAAVPRRHQAGALSAIEGSVPNLVDPPAGCRFHPRCKHVMPACRTQVPPLRALHHDHQVACHLY